MFFGIMFRSMQVFRGVKLSFCIVFFKVIRCYLRPIKVHNEKALRITIQSLIPSIVQVRFYNYKKIAP